MNEQQDGPASAKAGRILLVARELLLKRGVRGVTVAEIAEKARVGKGTVYLYWSSKEDLFASLVARDFLAGVEETAGALAADDEMARPARLCPVVLRSALEHPLVHAVYEGDPDLMGLLAGYPRSRHLIGRFGQGVGGAELVEVWRRHGMARTDWAAADQVVALQALAAGFVDMTLRRDPGEVVPADLIERVLPAAVTALLGPDHSDAAGLRAAAVEMRELFDTVRGGVQSLVADPV